MSTYVGTPPPPRSHSRKGWWIAGGVAGAMALGVGSCGLLAIGAALGGASSATPSATADEAAEPEPRSESGPSEVPVFVKVTECAGGVLGRMAIKAEVTNNTDDVHTYLVTFVVDKNEQGGVRKGQGSAVVSDLPGGATAEVQSTTTAPADGTVMFCSTSDVDTLG